MTCYALADNIWLFYVGGFFLGVGLSWTTTTMVGYIVGKWCKKNRGTVMGFILAGMNFLNMRKARKEGRDFVNPVDMDCKHCMICNISDDR